MDTRLIFILFLLCTFPECCFAQLNDFPGSNMAIRTAGSSLLIPGDARSSGMGAIGIAAASDQDALFWNPAAILFSEQRTGATLQFMPWFRALGIPDINRYTAGGFVTIGNPSEKRHPVSIGLSGRFLHLNEIVIFPPGIPPTQEIPRYEMEISISVSIKISDYIAIGSKFSYLDSRFTSLSNTRGPMNVVLGDLFVHARTQSSLFEMPLDIRGGIVLANLGPKVSYEPNLADEFLPTNLAIGYSLTLEISPLHRVLISQDARKLLVPSNTLSSDLSAWQGITTSFNDSQEGFRGELSEISTGFGIEYTFRDLLSIRSGYTWIHPDQGDRRMSTVGVGIHLQAITIDCALWVPIEQNNPFQNTLSVGVGWGV